MPAYDATPSVTLIRENHQFRSFLRPLIIRKVRRLSEKPPILVGGCGRSGTTLLLAMLAAHPSIYPIPHETRTFARWSREGDRWFPCSWRRISWYLLWYQRRRTQRRWCEKTPMNVRYLERILTYFRGRCRFIHVVRDGRDVLTSRHPRNPGGYWVSPRRWVKDVRAGLAHADHPSVHTVRYEDLVTDFTPTMREIYDFLEEPMPEGKWFDQTTFKKSGAWFHTLRRHHTGSVRRWEKPEYADRLSTVLSDPSVDALLRELGYR